jgi:radical SAM superfamily enzyme YgiQ (UPF0313 family)
MKKKKLLLINPDNPLKSKNFYEPIELGIIASITPEEEWDVEIMDLRVEDFSFKEVDLVAITAKIMNAQIAYSLLNIFRQKKIATVIGGIHASLCPEEAIQYADCVVIGEAENIWEELLRDFTKGTLKKTYIGSTNLNYKIDRSYYRHYYKTASIQFSRGCPLACDFCCIVKIHKQIHKHRGINDIIEEIKLTKQKLLFFMDENMYGFSPQNRNHVLQLFKEMIRQKITKRWIGMVSINAGIDDEFLYLARKSGCRLLIMGFESENKEILLSINKTQNAKYHSDYNKIVRNIHKFRIAICGVFMFGMESDTDSSIEQRKRYVLKSPIDSILATLYTPLPGSKIFDTFYAENKLLYTNFPDDWICYNFTTNTFKQNKIKNLSDLFIKIRSEIKAPGHLIYKFLLTIINTRSLSCALHSNSYYINHENGLEKVYFLRLMNWGFELCQKIHYKSKENII